MTQFCFFFLHFEWHINRSICLVLISMHCIRWLPKVYLCNGNIYLARRTIVNSNKYTFAIVKSQMSSRNSVAKIPLNMFSDSTVWVCVCTFTYIAQRFNTFCFSRLVNSCSPVWCFPIIIFLNCTHQMCVEQTQVPCFLFLAFLRPFDSPALKLHFPIIFHSRWLWMFWIWSLFV